MANLLLQLFCLADDLYLAGTKCKGIHYGITIPFLCFAFRDVQCTGHFLFVGQAKMKGAIFMQESIVKSYEELPLFLNAQQVANKLGVSISSAYELMHEKDFPSLRIGNRLVIPKENFRQWVEDKVGK
jgi:excisionase family DNA binding protein